jgi:hypothetical protein
MTCGDWGGVTTRGEPCKRKAGWGVPGTDDGRCKDHLEQEPAEPPPPSDWPVVVVAPDGYRLVVEATDYRDGGFGRVELDRVPVDDVQTTLQHGAWSALLLAAAEHRRTITLPAVSLNVAAGRVIGTVVET